MGHTHRAVKNRREGPYGYDHCVRPGQCVPKSHGGVVWVDVCTCGAKRSTNSNGMKKEIGPWIGAA
jgi:hypothetical protein